VVTDKAMLHNKNKLTVNDPNKKKTVYVRCIQTVDIEQSLTGVRADSCYSCGFVHENCNAARTQDKAADVAGITNIFS